MTSTDVAVSRRGFRPPSAPTNRNARVNAKLQAAIVAIIETGAELDAAALSAGITTHYLREALAKPHVIAWLKQRREVFRAAINGKNIYRLDKIANGDNQPAVNAIKTLEMMDDDRHQVAIGASHSPHLTIRIVNQVAAPGILNQKDVSPDAVTIPHDADEAAVGEK